jgi:hypothetical protein
MIKTIARKPDGGTLYMFGFSETNLNRMEFNNEPIFFDFGYIDRPDLFGLIHFFPGFKSPDAADFSEIAATAKAVLNSDRGVTAETLRFFVLSQNIMDEFRKTSFWGHETRISITHVNDSQIFFAAPTEQDIERYFIQNELIGPRTEQSHKGFGRRN